MDGYLRQFTLDVNAENNHQRIPAKQGDAVNRQLEITLLKDGVAFEPAGVASYAFRCEKPDGTAVVLEGTGSGAPIQAEGSGVYIITLADQCLAVAGRVICDFALVDGDGNILSSSDFILDVIPMPNIGNLVPSSTEWKRLMEAIETAENFSEILAFRENNGWIQYTTDNSTWTNLCEISDIVVPITTAEIDELWP